MQGGWYRPADRRVGPTVHLQQLERKPGEVPTRESALALMARGYAEGAKLTMADETAKGADEGSD